MEFICSICSFTTSKKNNYDRHLLTKKHQEKTKMCHCGKKFESRSGLWKHSHQCLYPILKSQEGMIQELLKKQEIFQEQVKELQQNTPSVYISIFLNDTCKEALNWSEFIKLIELSEHKSILNSIQSHLHSLGYKRPVHILPTKRLYIKQHNQWNYDELSIQSALQILNTHIHQQHYQLLQTWEKKHPHWYLNQQETELYTNLILQDVNESMLMVIVPP